jgi:hypothetical protein
VHPILLRLYQKALANQLAIVGSTLSDWKYSIPSFAEEIQKKFRFDFEVKHPLDYFALWNEFSRRGGEGHNTHADRRVRG